MNNENLHLLAINDNASGDIIIGNTNNPMIVVCGEKSMVLIGKTNHFDDNATFDPNENHEDVSYLGKLLNDCDEQTRNECLGSIASKALEGMPCGKDGKTTFYFYGCFKMKSKKNQSKYALLSLGKLMNTVVEKSHITTIFGHMLKCRNLKELDLDKNSIAYQLVG
jgi:hypothetical protein